MSIAGQNIYINKYTQPTLILQTEMSYLIVLCKTILLTAQSVWKKELNIPCGMQVIV